MDHQAALCKKRSLFDQKVLSMSLRQENICYSTGGARNDKNASFMVSVIDSRKVVI